MYTKYFCVMVNEIMERFVRELILDMTKARYVRTQNQDRAERTCFFSVVLTHRQMQGVNPFVSIIETRKGIFIAGNTTTSSTAAPAFICVSE